jgi:hypothetical protein
LSRVLVRTFARIQHSIIQCDSMLNSFDGRVFLRTGGAKGPCSFTNRMDRFGVGRAASTHKLGLPFRSLDEGRSVSCHALEQIH